MSERHDVPEGQPAENPPTPAAPAAAGTETKGKLGPTALRFASAVPLIPLILWLLFYGPRWGFHTFCFVGVAIFAGVLGLGFVAMITSLLRPDPVETSGARAGWLFGGPVYIGGLLITVDLLHGLPFGARWVVLAMMLAFLSDTAAYFAGRAFGKHKLYEKLSPKKTIEGSLGGLAGAVGGAFFAIYVMKLPIPVPHAIALGVIAGALGQAGDLLESMLKRSAGVKDSGNILPGHGGLLDRVDALMFTASTTWLYAVYLLDAR